MKAIPTWKQRKLQDVLTVNSGSDYKHLETGEIPVYGTGGYMLSVNDNLSKSDSIGIGRKGTIDKPQYLKAPFWTVDTLFFMTPFKNFDINFLFALSQKINWKRMDQSTGVPSLSKVVIEKTMEYFPSLGEQQSIGFLFRQFDKAITLHQEKLNKLQELKKTTLQTLFPKRDEKIPKVRFTNFNELWKKHKLKDNTEMYDNLRIPVTKSERVHGNIPYYGANGIQDYVNNYTHDGEYVLIAEDGATDLINYPVNYIKGKAWVNNHAHVLSGRENRLDNLFLHARLKTMNISAWLVGGSRAKLNGGVLRELPLVVPAFVEQQKIGNFFQQLDNSITLYQSKLEKLQTLKKVFLQKMFI